MKQIGKGNLSTYLVEEAEKALDAIELDEGKAFIAMELLDGEPLGDRIARTKGMPADEALRFLTEVLRAIHKAHEAGIVHRDLKPDNVFIVKDEPEYVKVLDFGVAKVQRGELGGSAGRVSRVDPSSHVSGPRSSSGNRTSPPPARGGLLESRWNGTRNACRSVGMARRAVPRRTR